MRKAAIVSILILIIAGSSVFGSDSTSKTWELIKPGPYTVGYLEVTAVVDSTFKLVNEDFRAVTIAMWYPDVKKSRGLAKKKVPTKFPIILLCPGIEAKFDVYLSMVRFLSSHGFVVVTFPSSGDRYTYRQEVYRWDFRLLQQEYLRLSLMRSGRLIFADSNNVGIIGHSYGGPAAINFAVSENKIDAVVSLDGTDVCAGYTEKMAEQFPDYNPDNLTDPFMLILADQSYCIGERRSLDFFDGLSKADAFLLQLHNFRHEHFAFSPVYDTDPAVKKSFEVASLYMLNFFKANLYGDNKAGDWLSKAPEDLGLPTDLFKLKRKSGE